MRRKRVAIIIPLSIPNVVTGNNGVLPSMLGMMKKRISPFVVITTCRMNRRAEKRMRKRVLFIDS